MVYVKTLADGLDVVVGSAGGFAAENHSVDELFVVYFKTHHMVYLGIESLEKFFKRYGLGDGAGEAVKDNTFLKNFGVILEDIGKELDNEVVGNQLAFRDILVGNDAKLCATGDVVAEHLTGRDMVQAITLDHLLALSAFAAAGAAKNYYIHEIKGIRLRQPVL